MDSHQVADAACGYLVLLKWVDISNTQDLDFVATPSDMAAVAKLRLVQGSVNPKTVQKLNVLP